MKSLTIIFLPLLVASCTTAKYYPVPVPEYKREYTLRAPKGRVTEPAEVEAYPVARYVDPGNKNIMHEKHFVYRRQAPKWKLASEPSERVALGSVAGLYGGREKGRPSASAVEDAVVSQRDALRRVGSLESDMQALGSNQKNLSMIQLEMLQEATNRKLKEQREEAKSAAEEAKAAAQPTPQPAPLSTEESNPSTDQ